MKNVRVKVVESCGGYSWWYAICDGKKRLLISGARKNGFCSWQRKDAAIRNAKAMAKRIGIPYDPEIIKQRGC